MHNYFDFCSNGKGSEGSDMIRSPSLRPASDSLRIAIVLGTGFERPLFAHLRHRETSRVDVKRTYLDRGNSQQATVSPLDLALKF
jgi:hypothetical protein